MAPGLLAPTPSCPSLFSAYSSSASIKGSMSANTTLSATAIPRSSSATPTGGSSASSLLSPTYAKNSSTSSQTHAQGTTGLALAYFTQRRLQRQGSNPTLRISPTLPDISESPTTPTPKNNGLFPITEPQLRDSQTTDGHLKESNGLNDRPVSFVSDWSETSNASGGKLRFKGDLLDLDGTESVFDGSVYEDGCEEEEDVWKAEKVLAGVKKRLDAFEHNISKARESIITSPKSLINTPQSVHPRTILRPFPVNPTNPRPKNLNSHFRNASESAVPAQFDSITRRLEGPRSESVTELYRPDGQRSAPSTMTRQDSAKQMRDLQDQMKDLRGRITNLQERTRHDSLRRRSQSAARHTPLNNIFQSPNSVYSNNLASSSTSSFFSTTEGDMARDEISSEDGSRCGTPKPFPILRKSMSYEELGYDTAFSTPGDEPTQIVSFPRRNRVRGARSNSSSGSSEASTATAVQTVQTAAVLASPPPVVNTLTTVTSLTRTESFHSISSYETALEDDDFESPIDPVEYSLRQNMLSPQRSMNLRTVLDVVPDEEVEGELQGSPINDDGYHSGPSTPQDEPEKSSDYSQKALTYEVEPKTVPLTREAHNEAQLPANIVSSDAARTATDSIIGAENDELALKLPTRDRLLVENLCEELGKVCCRMELETDSSERKHIRKKLEMALAVLRGDS